MDLYIWALFSFLIIFFSVAEYIKRRRREEKRKENLQNLTASFLSKYYEYENAVKEFKKLYTGYVANYPFNLLRENYRGLYERIDFDKYHQMMLSPDEIILINKFVDYYNRTQQYVADHNRNFVEKELDDRKQYFNKVSGVPLDNQQRRSIIIDEDNSLVVAGAGSGKTTTIVGKVKYLVEKCNVRPERILLMSFTNKAVSNLEEKVNVQGVVAKTFNSFGLEVLTDSKHKQSIFEPEQFPLLVTTLFDEQLKENKYLEKVSNFFISGYKVEKDMFDFDCHGDYIQALKDENFQPISLINSHRSKETFANEKVKSFEECKIANFLYINRIEYIYEYPYEFDTATKDKRQYKPDFTIFLGQKRIYLEHFGINREGQPAPIFNDPLEYQKGIQWKRGIHRTKNTILVESYSYENSEGILLDKLKQNLEAQGVKFNPLGKEELWGILQRKDPRLKIKFLELIQTFIVLLKSNNSTIDDLRIDIEDGKNGLDKIRSTQFLDIIEPVYCKYQQHLEKRGEIDFSDMINLATRSISSGQYYKKFDYVIVDEFQDLSIGRYNLIRALKESNPFCKLFAVGDDWQSIYRFAGSDITLFSDFQKYFGYTSLSKIETTYRFSEPLIKISSDFVLKNPNQINKNLVTNAKQGKTNLNLIYYDANADNENIFPSFLEGLISILEEHVVVNYEDLTKIKDGEILLLGRYNYDINRLMSRDSKDKEHQKLALRFRVVGENVLYTSSKGELVMKFLSVHKAKGLEAEFVILMNNDAGDYGFPSLRSDDPILSLLLSGADQFDNGEERRLFYVALTRARKEVYLIVNNSSMSKFIFELTNKGDKELKCPRCKRGQIQHKTGISKSGNSWSFKSCSNFGYGCEYQEWI